MSDAAGLTPRAEVIRLMLALGEDHPSETDVARLNALLLSDADAQSAYLTQIELLGNLYWDRLAGPSLPAIADAVVARLTSSDPESQELLRWLGESDRDATLAKEAFLAEIWSDDANLLPILPPAATPLGFVHVALASLVTLCVVGLLAVAVAPRRAPAPAGQGAAEAAPVATVSGATGAHWQNRAPPLPQDGLVPGRSLRLDEGTMRLQFASGATVVLHAPVDFQVLDERRCRLDRGRLAAEVSAACVGFTVETPTSTVVDLGTQFEVDVDQGGRSEVRVFRGTVEVSRVASAGPAEHDQTALSRAGPAPRQSGRPVCRRASGRTVSRRRPTAGRRHTASQQLCRFAAG